MMSRFTHGNLTSILKVLDGKSQLQPDTVRHFDNWRDSGQSNARARAWRNGWRTAWRSSSRHCLSGL